VRWVLAGPCTRPVSGAVGWVRYEVPDRGDGVCEGEVKADRCSTPDKIDFSSGVGHRLTLKCETQTFGLWAEKPASDSQGQGREYVTPVSECSKRDGN
jgi:hypothetical protein